MSIYEILALASCAVGAGLGGYAFFNPGWASRLVRLVPMEGKKEGPSEFRATLGLLFFGTHAFGAWALITSQPGADMAAATLGAAWLGSSVGRAVSLFVDNTMSRLNVFNVFFEFTLGCVLFTPLLLG